MNDKSNLGTLGLYDIEKTNEVSAEILDEQLARLSPAIRAKYAVYLEKVKNLILTKWSRNVPESLFQLSEDELKSYFHWQLAFFEHSLSDIESKGRGKMDMILLPLTLTEGRFMTAIQSIVLKAMLPEVSMNDKGSAVWPVLPSLTPETYLLSQKFKMALGKEYPAAVGKVDNMLEYGREIAAEKQSVDLEELEKDLKHIPYLRLWSQKSMDKIGYGYLRNTFHEQASQYLFQMIFSDWIPTKDNLSDRYFKIKSTDFFYKKTVDYYVPYISKRFFVNYFGVCQEKVDDQLYQDLVDSCFALAWSKFLINNQWQKATGEEKKELQVKWQEEANEIWRKIIGEIKLHAGKREVAEMLEKKKINEGWEMERINNSVLKQLEPVAEMLMKVKADPKNNRWIYQEVKEEDLNKSRLLRRTVFDFAWVDIKGVNGIELSRDLFKEKLEGLKKLVNSIDDVHELVELLLCVENFAGALGYKELRELIFVKIYQSGSIKIPLKYYVPVKRARETSWDKKQMQAFLNVDPLVGNKMIVEELLNFDVSTHHNAIKVFCDQVVEGKWGIVEILLEKMITSTQDLVDGNKVVTLSLMMERLQALGGPVVMEKYQSRLLVSCQLVGASKEEMMLFVKALNMFNPAFDQSKLEMGGSMEQKKIELDFPVRNLSDLKNLILEKRTSHISRPDGNKVSLAKNEFASPLAGEIVGSIHLKANKETGNAPKGLACNVVLSMKNAEGGELYNMYFKLDQKGDLWMRVLDPNGRELAVKNCREAFCDEKMWQEFNYLILEALRIVCVRTKIIPKVKIEEIAGEEKIAASEVDEKKDEVEEPKSVIEIPEGMRETVEREEGPMSIDLTEEEEVSRKRLKRVEKVFIESNKAKVKKAFGPLLNGGVLPEKCEVNLEKVVLYTKRIIKDGKRKGTSLVYFERFLDTTKVYEAVRRGDLSIEQIYVRKTRAFSQNLPFIISKEQKESSLYVAKSKKMSEQALMKRDLFVLGEESGEIQLSSLKKILVFEVKDDSTELQKSFNRKLWESMRDRNYLEGVKRTMERLKKEELAEEIYLLREKFKDCLEGDGYLKSVSALEEKYQLECEQERKNIDESRSRVLEKNIEVVDGAKTRQIRKLSLPQIGFTFESTFNEGIFQTLEEVLKEEG